MKIYSDRKIIFNTETSLKYLLKCLNEGLSSGFDKVEFDYQEIPNRVDVVYLKMFKELNQEEIIKELYKEIEILKEQLVYAKTIRED